MEINFIGMIIVILAVIFDIVTGLIKCYCGTSEKSENGKFKSTIMRKCGLQKVGIFVFLVLIEGVSYYFDVPLIAEIAYTYYIITESLSVCENLNLIGVKIPTKILKFFEERKEE